MVEATAEITTRPGKESPQLTPSGKDWIAHKAQDLVEFTSAFSHEINSPLATMAADIDFLKSRFGPTEELDSLLSVRERVNRMIKRLNYAAQYCQEGGYSFRRFSPEKLKLDLESEFEGKGLSFEGDLSGFSESDEVLIDTPRLTGALEELVKNSTEAEAKKIVVQMSRKEDGLEISLADDGQGISVEPEKLFGFNTSTKVAEGGRLREMSLGLVIAKTVVSLHGGEIQVSNREAEGEKGTVVRITLPLAQK